eukprot:m.182657 g.182657  ORF g.182657 m.182657 type:complete len:331 (+) comp15591_c0_seq1:233-1225(+)
MARSNTRPTRSASVTTIIVLGIALLVACACLPTACALTFGFGGPFRHPLARPVHHMLGFASPGNMHSGIFPFPQHVTRPPLPVPSFFQHPFMREPDASMFRRPSPLPWHHPSAGCSGGHPAVQQPSPQPEPDRHTPSPGITDTRTVQPSTMDQAKPAINHAPPQQKQPHPPLSHVDVPSVHPQLRPHPSRDDHAHTRDGNGDGNNEATTSVTADKGAPNIPSPMPPHGEQVDQAPTPSAPTDHPSHDEPEQQRPLTPEEQLEAEVLRELLDEAGEHVPGVRPEWSSAETQGKGRVDLVRAKVRTRPAFHTAATVQHKEGTTLPESAEPTA